VAALASWKLGSSEGEASLHGFGESDQPLKGLSLLFDPVVDFSLASHMFCNGALPVDPIVMVLTDYYPFCKSDVIATIEKCWSRQEDWGQRETTSYNEPNYWSDAMYYLKWALLNVETEASPRPCLNVPTNPALELIVKNHILLWNFLPMFRGGTIATGTTGLPVGDDWRLKCIEWMMRFVTGTGGSDVLLCFSQKLGMQISRTGSLNDYSVPNPPARWYRPDIGPVTEKLDCAFTAAFPHVRECYRLTHPGGWKRNNEPIREMVRSVIRRHRGQC
jgi:hypothetical protein